ncbi:AarF/UbiB family protein [Micromonospora sp. M12]
MPPAVLRRIVADDAPQVGQLDECPVAVGAIGQVHRAVWPDGRTVAVKVQHPNAPTVLREELERARLSFRTLNLVLPGYPLAPLWEEFHRHAVADLDYPGEAAHQSAFAEAYRGDPEILVPEVRLAGRRLLVTDWVDGEPVTEIIATGTRQQRDGVAGLVTTFQLSAPARAGRIHADPDGDNFRLLPDGRLAVLDFGAAAPYPDGFPREFGRLLRALLDRDAEQLDETLRELGAVGAPGRIARTGCWPSPSPRCCRCSLPGSGSTGTGCAGRPDRWPSAVAWPSPAVCACRRDTCRCCAWSWGPCTCSAGSTPRRTTPDPSLVGCRVSRCVLLDRAGRRGRSHGDSGTIAIGSPPWNKLGERGGQQGQFDRPASTQTGD